MKKILVADDEESMRFLINAILEQAGYELIEAADGREALAKARERSPDLLILDVIMPEMNGFDVCRALKTDLSTAGIKVVILTARAEQASLDRAMAAGADCFLVKPFSPLKLLGLVREILGNGGKEVREAD